MPCDIDFAFAIMFSNFCDGFPCARTQTATVYHGVKELCYGVGYRYHLPVPVEHEGDLLKKYDSLVLFHAGKGVGEVEYIDTATVEVAKQCRFLGGQCRRRFVAQGALPHVVARCKVASGGNVVYLLTLCGCHLCGDGARPHSLWRQLLSIRLFGVIAGAIVCIIHI